MDKILQTLKPLYLNSSDYSGTDWRNKEDCNVFSNRKLCKYEFVADFDSITLDDKTTIMLWFIRHNFKFWMYESSITGVHVHFFIKGVYSKYQKREVLRLIQDNIGIDIDSGPVMRGWIRAEDSVHPIKKTIKKLVFTNVDENAYLSVVFYENELSPSLKEKVFNISPHDPIINIKPEIDVPIAIKFMNNNAFTNGRKRILFCLISWWKSQKFSNQEIYHKSRDWLRRQNYYMSDRHIWASIGCSTGRVRDSYRLSLLKELGFELK